MRKGQWGILNHQEGYIPNDFIDRITKNQVHQQVSNADTESVTQPPSDCISPSSSSQLGENPPETLPQIPKLKYSDPIRKQKVVTFDNLVPKKKKLSIIEDEGKSFAAILGDYDQQKLNLDAIMHWPITSKPWSICNEQGVSRPSSKSLLRNNLQLLSPKPATSIVPDDIQSCVVDAMRVVRIIPINGLSTFKSWALRVVNYLRALPGTPLHLVFDNYSPYHDNLYLSKGRPDRGRERRVSDLSQTLPKLSEWNNFLTNDLNKFRTCRLHFIWGIWSQERCIICKQRR